MFFESLHVSDLRNAGSHYRPSSVPPSVEDRWRTLRDHLRPHQSSRGVAGHGVLKCCKGWCIVSCHHNFKRVYRCTWPASGWVASQAFVFVGSEWNSGGIQVGVAFGGGGAAIDGELAAPPETHATELSTLLYTAPFDNYKRGTSPIVLYAISQLCFVDFYIVVVSIAIRLIAAAHIPRSAITRPWNLVQERSRRRCLVQDSTLTSTHTQNGRKTPKEHWPFAGLASRP